MSATVQAPRVAIPNRRRRVRQKVHAPAYASFAGTSRGEMIELYEVLDISEVGVALQCPAQLETNRPVELCLDLAEASGQISTPARIIWSDSTGRTGIALAPLANPVLHRLREWLFLNAMAAAANSSSGATHPSSTAKHAELRPTYTDTLNAASVVQREAESLGSDLETILSLVASRSQTLLGGSGAAIALAGKDPAVMICRASAGPCAPPVGAGLQVGSGFSGECVRTGSMLRCDDTEADLRVDRESCRALGIRSMLAAPVRQDEKVVGLLEVFSAEPGAFTETHSAVLQRFADTILAATNRAAKQSERPVAPPPPEKPFRPPPGSVLFAHVPEEEIKKAKETPASGDADEDKVGGIRLPRAHLYLLIGVAATIFLALGFVSAPWIQPWVQARLLAPADTGEQTVLASSPQPTAFQQRQTSDTSVELANVDQLREMAEHGAAAAEERLGRLYAEGDDKQGIEPDDREAARWFTSAAEHGNVSAQYKLALLYWGGHHGLPKDPNKAYFWTVLARAGGQEGSKDLATFLASAMTRPQAAAIEQQAELWYRRHEPNAKPSAGH